MPQPGKNHKHNAHRQIFRCRQCQRWHFDYVRPGGKRVDGWPLDICAGCATRPLSYRQPDHPDRGLLNFED